MTSETDARLEVAQAIRDLNHAYVAYEIDADELLELGRTIAGVTESLRRGERRDRLALMQAARASAPEGATFASGMPGSGFEDRAVGGQTNPTGVDMTVDMANDEIVAEVFLRRAFEGAPGRAHGGIVAAAFDDITGFVIGKHGQPAFTGELTVRFLAPVPVEEPLIVRARLDGSERRKLFISADATAGDTLVATCKAIYITVDPSIFAGSPDPR
jgi:acyl-coenzyme A thioesterase PaaI-like protein